ncbi:MAG: HAMP domain-containing histidine kinase [Acidobacteria bacterium]|nr:HAMP domain-containing histidine kinase [Acidobacteriota bacterium]
MVSSSSTDQRYVVGLCHSDSRDQCFEKIAQFSKGIAHELNNTLQGLGIGFELVKGSLEPESPTFTYLSLMSEATQRLNFLANRLRAFDTLKEWQPTRVSVQTLIDSAFHELTPDLSETVDWNTVIDTKHEAMVDPRHMSLALAAALTNAAEACPEGCVKTKTRITKSGSRDLSIEGGAVVVSITDSGPGLQHAERIFQPFYSTKGKGRGLGLPFIQAACMRNKTITVFQNMSSGTRVDFYLPRF